MRFRGVHPPTFTASRLQFLAARLTGGMANDGDISEAGVKLAYVAKLMEEGKL